MAAAALPVVLRNPYYLNLVIIAGMNAALAMTFVLTLRTGLVNMAIAAFLEIGATATAVLMVKAGWPFWVSLPVGAVAAALVGLIVGLPLLKNSGFTFVMLTAVFAMLVPQVFASLRSIGGFSGLQGIPTPPPVHLGGLELDLGSKSGMYYVMLALVLFSVVGLQALYAGRAGRAWLSIGLNPRLAGSVGVNVFRNRLLAFVVACGIAGMIGGLYGVYLGAVVPTQFTVFKTISIHIAAIVGGIPFPLLGPVVGAAFMTALPELLRWAPSAMPIVLGVLYILAILLLPDGLLSLVWPQQGERALVRWLPRLVGGLRRAAPRGGGEG